jgi:acetaldehyde dehydrogenase/alcohol dehydrogenase
MWVLYEYPEADFADLALRFMDIQEARRDLPRAAEEGQLVCVSTTSAPARR